jgi:hypothetical protein
MRRKILIGLIIVAVLVYGWDVFLLVKHPGTVSDIINKDNSASDFSAEKYIAGSKPVRFVKSDRSPFLPRRTEKVMATTKAVPAFAPANAVKPPDVRINGIMWDPVSPVAMITLPDGSTAAIKAGQSAGEVIVDKIEKDKIQITFQNNSFWISR